MPFARGPPAIDATCVTRVMPAGVTYDAAMGNALNAYTLNADPERPFTPWQPLLGLGDATTVMLRQNISATM